MELKGLTGKVKAWILGVLKSDSPHLDFFVGTDAAILMTRFALSRMIPSDGAHALSEDEETKRMLILSGYAWITFLVSSLGLRSIRLWYFGVPFWNFSRYWYREFPFWNSSTYHEEGTLPEELVALEHGTLKLLKNRDKKVLEELVSLKHGDFVVIEVYGSDNCAS
ncbi:Hypothetical predicted protein [Olea europaea subsp. europaea]|uniref:Uncharacterized protein n=1 Tax=Olea europaea subsp. europaea TaxID=158383 RepID=A0A8S0UTX1_OLEEU|nr:Hypothetical predicted protein [Olea europaea subsp. europaea]